MKKDYLILAIFLGLTIISGAALFAVQNSNSNTAVPGLQTSQMSGADSTLILGEIAKNEKRLKNNPDDYDALINLGNSYYDINNPSEAIEYYERSLKIKSDNPAVLVDLGAMYRKTGNTDRAFDLFNRAIEINPRLPQAYFNLGMIYHTEKNDPASAVKAWRKYLEYETNPEARKFVESLLKNAESEANR